jgi:homoserine dehydrogenase
LKEVRLGILGFGAVGKSLINIIQENHTRIMKEYGIDLIIKRVYSEEKEISKEYKSKGLYITNNIEEVIFGERVDIVCEALEEKEPEFVSKHIIRTLKGKRSMIISSCRALATDIKEVIKAMSDNKVDIRYDACVGGGIPVAKVLETAFTGDKIVGIGGIFSKLKTNLYSETEKEKTTLISDYIDYETMSQLVILGLYGMNTVIDLKNMKIAPLILPDKTDLAGCERLGYAIKEMGVLNKSSHGLFYYTGPVAVKTCDILANISPNDCLIFLEGEKYGRLEFLSQNMREIQMALAMFDDLINLLTLKRNKNPVKININEMPPQKCLDGKYLLTIPWYEGVKEFITAISLEENIPVSNMFKYEERLFLETKEISWATKEEFARHLMEEGVQIKSTIPVFS